MRCLFPLMAMTALLIGISVLRADDAPAAPSKKVQKVMRLTDADNGKTAAVAVEKPFNVFLKGNASTGFQWQVGKIDGDAVEQVGKVDYVLDKNPNKMAGIGGKYIIHFKVTKAAKTKIHLVYLRPWEKDTPPAKTFDVIIDSTAQEPRYDKPATPPTADSTR
jgi:inhibitor of cysteine peptidase